MSVMQSENHNMVNEKKSVQIEDNEQYLTFFMADEEYGVDILCVQEIRGWESARVIPNTSPSVKGVLDLRGVIVPIIDLRRCFGFEDVEYGPMTVVIVIKVHSDGVARTIGILVDAVSDVYTLGKNEMKSAPELGDDCSTEYIRGMVNINNKMVILLNTDMLFNLREMPNFKEIAELSSTKH